MTTGKDAVRQMMGQGRPATSSMTIPDRVIACKKLLKEWGLGLITDTELRDEMISLWFPEP